MFSELPEKSAPFLSPPVFDDEAMAVLRSPEAGSVLRALDDALRASVAEITAEQFKSMVKTVGKAEGHKGKALYFPVRAALTGAVHGPDLAGIAEIKGRSAVLELLEHARRIPDD